MLNPTALPGLQIFKDFIPIDLHDAFIRQMHLGISEQNKGHYDGYSFLDDRSFDNVFLPLIEYTFAQLKQMQVFKNGIDKPIKLGCSIVGYKKDGYINRHVDSTLLSGDTVVVLSFASPVVINFYNEKDKSLPPQKFFIPPRALYVMADKIRYEWSHEIKPDECTYQGQKFRRGTRYSLLLFEPGVQYQGDLLSY